MKILELGKFYSPVRGGIETLLESLCRGFVAKGASVRCVVANTGRRAVREEKHGVSLGRCGSFGTIFSTSLAPRYFREALRDHSHIWHAHFPNPLADFALLRAPETARVVITYHSDIIRQAGFMRFYGPVADRCLRRADKIVVATPRHLEFSPRLQRFRDNIVVIPFGIDASKFQRASPLPTSVPRASGGPILLTVGRLVGYKGHRYLIEAMHHLNATLWIAGTGPLEAQLRKQAAAANLTDRIHFLGGVTDDQLPALYQHCDIFVLPSITPNEAFGLVQLEAMACGKPVISCDLRSGVPWVNQHNVTGLVVPPGDAKALATAVEHLATNPEKAKRFGETGRARLENEFTETKMVDRYFALFEELVGS